MLYFLFIITFLFSAPLFSINETEEIYAEDDCMEFVGEELSRGGSYGVKLWNTCSTKVFVNVCVEETPGRFRLHQSKTKVPKFGYFTAYSWEGVRPYSLSWLSSTALPEVPPPCFIEEEEGD